MGHCYVLFKTFSDEIIICFVLMQILHILIAFMYVGAFCVEE
jgi:hypothetical protein